MKISYSWLKDYLDFEETPHELGAILTEIGLEVEGIEKLENIPGGLKGVVTGKVVECEQHPNADRLSKTKVDIGEPELLSVVCGAPNVAAGQKVLVAPVGTVLYPEGLDKPFKIKKSKIRGEVSEGMICAEDELGLGDSHDGIMVLDESQAIGVPASEIFDLKIDYVYEIGLTPNRSDATSHLGVARDLAAALTIIHDRSYTVKIPDVSSFNTQTIKHDIGVEIGNLDLCPRYTSVTVGELKIGPSPQWIVDRLKSIGIRSKNNVVDITNFILHELGQPLHAFDLSALKGSQVYVETLEEGQKFTTLDDIEITLSSEDLMICNAQHEPMCIGGVYGGLHSGVSDKTIHIFLESAHFQPETVRKSSKKHNFRTEAAKVFEKGSDPAITKYALKRAALLMQEWAGGVITSEISDIYPEPILPKIIPVRYSQIKRIMGFDIEESMIVKILKAMDIEIIKQFDDHIEVAIPTDKADVTREADVIEEILRIYGFNSVPVDGRLTIALDSGKKEEHLPLRNQLSSVLVGMGLNEIMGLSLTGQKYLPNYMEEERLVRINNTSNRDLDIMRPSMLVTMLQTIEYNQKRQINDLQLFEFGSTYVSPQPSQYKETQHLAIGLTGKIRNLNWTTAEESSSFYQLKSVVERIFESLNIGKVQQSNIESEDFHYGLRYHKGDTVLAEFGAVDLSVFSSVEVEGDVFVADIRWDELVKAKKNISRIQEVSRYPKVDRDLALITPKSVSYGDIEKVVRSTGKNIVADVQLFDVYENKEQLGEDLRSYGVKIVFSDPKKTLNDKEVDVVIRNILNKLQKNYAIELR